MAEELAAQAMTAVTETVSKPGQAAETAPSEPQPQAAAPSEPRADEPAQTQAPPNKRPLRELLREDPDYQAEFERELNAKVQKALAKRQREWERQQLSRAAEDPSVAIEYAQAKKQEIERALSQEESRARIEAEVRQELFVYAEDPEWKDAYEQLRTSKRDEFNARWREDPAGFARWADRLVQKTLRERAVEQAIKEKLPVVAKAEATHMTAAALQKVPVPPTGSGASGDMALLARVKEMSAAEYAANRDKIFAALKRHGGR